MQTKTPVTPSVVEIPEDIICPITSHIMTDPVMLTESGNTYEREALLTWLKTKKTDPLTNEVISDETIVPNRAIKRMIQTFLDKQRALNPNISDQTYLPESMVQTLISALEKNDLPLFKDTLKKDSRLLFNELKEKKTIFMLSCESGSLEILEVVLSALGDKIKQLTCVEKDQGLSIFLSVGRRLGLKGAACISKAMGWNASDFQSVLVASIQEADSAMVEIALSLGAVTTLELLDQAYVEKKPAIVKVLVSLGMSIDQVDAKSNTALHRYAMEGKDDIVKLLMKKNASIKDKNNDGKTPVQLARENGHKDLANWMEEKHRYKKVKPFLKPLEAKFESKIQEQAAAIETLKSQLASLIGAEKTANSSVNTSSFFKAENTATTTSTTTTNTTTTVTTTPVTSSHAEQVEAMSKSVQSNINPHELSALLKWVTEGHLVEVEKLLKKNPTLGLGMGSVTDRSDRTFTNVTALQYAAWSLDAEMSELIIGYIGARNTSIQLNALANEPSRYSAYGTSYDYTPLVSKTKTYVDNYNNRSKEQNCQYWQKEVGGEQRKCPAWLIYAWSEEGSDVAWTKKDANRKIKREYDRNCLDWWFTENYNRGSGVGSSWASTRGAQDEVRWAMGGGGWWSPHDIECASILVKSRSETLQRLRFNADSQLNQATVGLGKGQ